jgi:hypothetical protein
MVKFINMEISYWYKPTADVCCSDMWVSTGLLWHQLPGLAWPRLDMTACILFR